VPGQILVPPGNEVDVGIADPDVRLLKIGLGLYRTGSAEQAPVWSSFKATFDRVAPHRFLF